MDSLTQIVLGAAVAEAVAGRKMGAKAALWGAIAGTIPDLDVFLGQFFHPIDAALVHRGFSHSLIFAMLAGPVLGWLVHRLYKNKYALKTWTWLFFLSIVTHPILDIFTNYGTEFFWPFSLRITFNTVFVIDPLYTFPFMFFLLVALFTKREKPSRKKWNMAGIYYSSAYLLWGVIVKLVILNNSASYFEQANIKAKNTFVTPMPLTSFYWMILTEDDDNFYYGYKSLFYPFQTDEIETIKKEKQALFDLKWPDKNYSRTLNFISKGYYTTRQAEDTLYYYDLRFGTTTNITNGKLNYPLMGYGMVIDNGAVQKTFSIRPSELMKHVNFGQYINKVFKK